MEPAWEKVQGGNFSLLQKVYNLPNGGTKLTPYYALTKTECLYIATKFNDIIVVQPSDGDPYNVVMLVWAMAIVENGERYKNLIDRGEICKGYDLAFSPL